MFDLTGCRALVTGSSQGIGFELARGLAGAGAEVVLNGLNVGRLANAAASGDTLTTGHIGKSEQIGCTEDRLAVAVGAGRMDIVPDNIVAHQAVDDMDTFAISGAEDESVSQEVPFIHEGVCTDLTISMSKNDCRKVIRL